MTRGRPLLAAALAVAAAACTSKGSAPDRANFSQPSSAAVFWGYSTAHGSGMPQPYVAVANENRNDLTFVDATNDIVVSAPVLLRPLSVPFGDRPALLGGALLGDAYPADANGFETPRPSLLVGVAAGSSVLQLVKTWDPASGIDDTQAVDLGADVLGIAAFPPSPPAQGIARLAVALAGKKLAVVQYRRDTASDAIKKDAVVVHGLGFEPAAIATVVPTLAEKPGVPDEAHVYAATLDPLSDATLGTVHGVAEIDVSAPAEPWTYRALEARAPTRLVAAARLQEKVRTTLATDPAAFQAQPFVTRVYAVLDEASCGPQRRIDCGLVVLDPSLAPAAGGSHIPADAAGWMPYRAPIPTGPRPSALAVATPSFRPYPGYEAWGQGAMLVQSTGAEATTAVALVAHEGGLLQFHDLGRYKVTSLVNAVQSASGAASMPSDASRFWLADANGPVAFDQSPNAIALTPGYARDETWKVAYQGALPGLQDRAAEAWLEGGQTVLALQVGEGAPNAPACTAAPGAGCRSLTQVALLWHPALGVRVGDVVAFKAARVPSCTGEAPPNTPSDQLQTVAKEFEATITALRAPTAGAPGGSVVLAPRRRGTAEPATPASWGDCWTALQSAIAAPSAGLKGLLVTVEAGTPDPDGRNALVLTGTAAGYAGRPPLATAANGWAGYVLQYRANDANGNPITPNEDQLAAQCPLADWTGSWPVPTCGGACDRAVCEQLVLARKARRVHHVAEDCTTNQTDATTIANCQAKYPAATFPFPVANGPALSFRIAHDWSGRTSGSTEPALVRGLLLQFSSFSGANPLTASPGGAQTRPERVVTFDRSPFDPSSAYRFFVLYPGDQMADTTPVVSPAANNVVR